MDEISEIWFCFQLRAFIGRDNPTEYREPKPFSYQWRTILRLEIRSSETPCRNTGKPGQKLARLDRTDKLQVYRSGLYPGSTRQGDESDVIYLVVRCVIECISCRR